MGDHYRSISIRTCCCFLSSFLFVHLCLLFIAADLVYAEEGAALDEKAPDSIEGALEQRDELVYDPRRRSLFPEFYYKLRKKRLDWWQQHRVDFTLTYDLLTQAYNDRDVSISGTAGDLSLSGSWLILGEQFDKPIFLDFRFRDRRAYSEYAPSDIQGQTDLLWGTVKGFNNSGFQIPDLYFRQELFDTRLILRYGQFTIDHFVDKHTLRSAKRFFLNQAFSDNPTISFPSYGAGFNFTWKPNDILEITGGGSNIQGTEGDTQVDFGIDSSALFGTIQAIYNFKGIAHRNGRLQVMGWDSYENNEDDYKAGNGFSITLEHGGKDTGETYVIRYAQSNGDPTDTDTIFFMGYGKDIRGFDSLGLGLGTGQSSTTSEWQTVFETYYRWQLTKELIVTPDLQIIVGDDDQGNSKTRVVGGIRIGVVF